MKNIAYEDIISGCIISDAIHHTHEPFVKDYLTLHSLLRIHECESVFEIGTHTGEGTNIICNAVPKSNVYSLDLPSQHSGKTLQHPKHKNMKVGENCKFTYLQILADSMIYDYSEYPCEAWFIDGEHDYKHPRHETGEAIKSKAKLIIWHDADIQEVYNAINDSFEWNKDYELYRVTGTAIAYAVRL